MYSRAKTLALVKCLMLSHNGSAAGPSFMPPALSVWSCLTGPLQPRYTPVIGDVNVHLSHAVKGPPSLVQRCFERRILLQLLPAASSHRSVLRHRNSILDLHAISAVLHASLPARRCCHCCYYKRSICLSSLQYSSFSSSSTFFVWQTQRRDHTESHRTRVYDRMATMISRKKKQKIASVWAQVL